MWMALIRELKAEHAKERERLLDRIQHPEQITAGTQLVMGEKTVHDPPKDVEELAWIGQEVPDFVNVGTNDQPELDPLLLDIKKMHK